MAKCVAAKVQILLLLCLAPLPSHKCDDNLTTPQPPPYCPEVLSVGIPEEEYRLEDDGNLVHRDKIYPVGTHWHDGNGTRACVCHVSPKPCLRKCCAPGEILSTSLSRDNPCQPDDAAGEAQDELKLEPHRTTSSMRHQLTSRPSIHDWFTLFKPSSQVCAEKFVFMDLNPDKYPEDAHVLHENGSLYMESTGLFGAERFCVDRQMGRTGLTVLVCLEQTEQEEETSTVVRIGYVLSVPFLAVTFLVYAIIPELRNIYGKTLMCYVFALLSAYSTIFATNFVEFSTVCHILAYIVHFSFLASFFWLNVMCFDIWWTFGGFRSLHGSVKQRERKKFIMYSIYAWGCASTLTSVCMIMDLVPGIPAHIIRPEFGRGSCWFNSNKARAIYFYGPMGVTVICNICLFILTAHKILKHKKDTARQLKGSDSKRHDDNKQWFNLYLKLFIVMGINWSMEIISWLLEDKLPKSVWYITDLTNTLQGVIIFIIFVWKDKIKRLLMKRFGCQGNNFLSRNSTSRSGCPTSSTSRTTCVTSAPLQEKINPYADSYRGKVTVTDESDCI